MMIQTMAPKTLNDAFERLIDAIVTVECDDGCQYISQTFQNFDMFEDDLAYYFSEKNNEDYNWRIYKEKITMQIICVDSVTIHLIDGRRIIITYETSSECEEEEYDDTKDEIEILDTSLFMDS